MKNNKVCCVLSWLPISTFLCSPLAGAIESPVQARDVQAPIYLAEAAPATSAPQASPAKGTEGQCANKMKDMMDSNKDGKVSRDEFMKHHEQKFEMHDKNKDGVLDDNEMGQMSEMMKNMGGMMGGMGGMKPGSGSPGGMEGMKH